MKRSIVAVLLGFVAATACGQGGHMLISNYVGYEMPIYFNPDPAFAPAGRANMAVHEADSITFGIFYAYGYFSDPALLTIPGVTFQVNDLFSWDGGFGHGPGGYFEVEQTFPAWNPADTVTLMYKVVTEGYVGSSALWQENAMIRPLDQPVLCSGAPPLMVSIIPEPTMLALAGLGAAALRIVRRKAK